MREEACQQTRPCAATRRGRTAFRVCTEVQEVAGECIVGCVNYVACYVCVTLARLVAGAVSVAVCVLEPGLATLGSGTTLSLA